MTNHLSQHEAYHRIAFINIPKNFDDGIEESDVAATLMNENEKVLKISQKFFTLCHNQIDCGL